MYDFRKLDRGDPSAVFAGQIVGSDTSGLSVASKASAKAAHEARLRLPRDAQTDALCAAVGVVAGTFRVTDAYLTAAADELVRRGVLRDAGWDEHGSLYSRV